MFRKVNVTLWVWGLMLGGFFVANAVAIYFATVSNPGLVVEDYYERGRDYEKNMLRKRAAASRWQGELAALKKLRVGEAAPFELSVAMADGSVPDPQSVTLYAYRPVDADHDFSVPMQPLDSGHYRALVTFPMPGAWDLLATVTKDGEEYSFPLRVQVAD